MKNGLQKRIINRLASSARTNSGRLHIIARKGEWVLKEEGVTEEVKTFKTKIEAVKDAKKILRKGDINKVVIHKKDGTISKVI